MLDAWIKDILYDYRDMPSLAREEMRGFLNFDLSKAHDIFVQDQLMYGLIEAPRFPINLPGRLIIKRRAAMQAISEELLNNSELRSENSSIVGQSMPRGTALSPADTLIDYIESDRKSTDSLSRVGSFSA